MFIFIKRGCIKLIQSDSKTFIILQKMSAFQINAFEQKYEAAQLFSTLIKKCFLISRSAYYNDHVTLKTGE